MKGIVFTEFLEMVEQTFGADMVDDIIEGASLPSGGAYTAVGTYDFREILALVTTLSAKTGIPVPQLVHAYGKYLFGRFVVGFPQFFRGVPDALSFLSSIEKYIHVEVRKLYPEAELPSFDADRRAPDTLLLTYRSTRPFADLAAGLIEGCLEHYRTPATVTREALPNEGGLTPVRFTIQTRTT